MKKLLMRSCIFWLILISIFAPSYAAVAIELVPMGTCAGIKLNTDGVIISGISQVTGIDSASSPAHSAGMLQGDIITSIDGTRIISGKQLSEIIDNSSGKRMTIELQRGEKRFNCSVTPALDSEGKYRLGIMIKDTLLGIGTITYVDPETGEYGALGHGIGDGNGNCLIKITDGTLVNGEVTGVICGEAGSPGELIGSFSGKTCGTVAANTDTGIFGIFDEPQDARKALLAADKSEIKVGDAQILSTVDGNGPELYSVRITSLYDSRDRNMIIEVTDKELISITGGIVQGMSGSPIIQNGKLVGAVTHVFVNDPARGYGVFIENMLKSNHGCE